MIPSKFSIKNKNTFTKADNNYYNYTSYMSGPNVQSKLSFFVSFSEAQLNLSILIIIWPASVMVVLFNIMHLLGEHALINN